MTEAALRVTVFDYGAGNLHSLVKALETPITTVRVETDAEKLLVDSDALVLPGVGAFSHAARRLLPGRTSVAEALRRGMPALGVCLGMQLLFDDSEEGEGKGLGLIGGRVERLATARVPQIGWNNVEWVEAESMDGALELAYYANGYVCRPSDDQSDCVVAWSEHEGSRFPAAVRFAETLGVQFHPEKSSRPGVQLVKRFLEHARAVREHTVNVWRPS